jgi:hypothetical protein
MSRQLDHNIEKDDKKKDRLKQLHPSISKFLLFASAKDSHTVPSDVTKACKRFINSETKGLADLELNIQFQERNFHNVAFSSGFTQAIYNGRFAGPTIIPQVISPLSQCSK